MVRITKIMAIVGILVLCGSAWAFSGSGSGTEQDPYIITDVYQLQEMADDLVAWYVLGNDIDATDTANWNAGQGFDPVGEWTGDSNNAFTGTFDGVGHSIQSLHISRIDNAGQGLFGCSWGATVQNVHLSNAEITADIASGPLVGKACVDSIISNCSATGTVTLKAGTADSKSGGLVGLAVDRTTVQRCWSGVNVNADSRKQVGGLIGFLEDYYALLSNSYSTGTVTGGGSKQGNLVGDADGSYVDRCYSCGYGKALIGHNWQSPVITNCYWDKDKGASSSSYGGSPKTTAQMMQQATFVGWDFVNTWDIVENETYPFLRAEAISEAGPVAHWKFDEGEGDIAYDSAGSNHGAIHGATWTTGIIGGALDFDGDKDYVEIPDDDSLTPRDEITIAFWLYNRGGQMAAGIYKYAWCPNESHSPGNSRAYYLHVSLVNGGTAHLRIYSSRDIYDTIHGSTVVQLNEWHHITGSFDHGNAAIYVDGQLDNARTMSVSSIMNDAQPLIIGGWWDYCGTDNFVSRLNGMADDVRIYNRALSAEEVEQLYQYEAGPVAHWKLDEGEGTIAYDSAGSNHGTIHGATWTTGIIDGALDFDGVDDYVDLGNDSNLKLPLPVTLSAWISFSQNGATIISLDDNSSRYYGVWFNLNFESGVSVAFGDGNGWDAPSYRRSKAGTMVLSPDTWYHVAAVVSAARDMGVYVNGVDDGGTYGGSGGSLAYSSGNASIGTSHHGNLYFDGQVDDVRVYGRALSAEEVGQLAQVEPPDVTQTYYVNGVNGSDLNEGLSPEAAFATIQKGIDVADDGDTVLVYPDVYGEPINFDGKAITVQGVATVDGVPVIQTPGAFAVSLLSGEDADSILKNFVISNSSVGIFLADASPTISNLTVVRNGTGIAAYGVSEPDINNCIFWNNTEHLYQCDARYSWVGEDVNEPTYPTDGLISYWEFDEDEGTIAYDSVGTNHGVIHNAIRTTGLIDGALDFDGNGDYVEIPNTETQQITTDQMTVGAWMMLDPEDNKRIQRRVISKQEASGIFWGMVLGEQGYNGSTGTQLVFGDSDGQSSWYNCLSPTSLNANQWYHVCATDEAGLIKIYVDGELDWSCDDGYGIPSNIDAPINIGSILSKYFFNGTMDELAMYSRALSAEEIRQIYQGAIGDGPLFAAAHNNDYHLLSERGRYWAAHEVWVLDEVTSPCIDGGDPAADPPAEPMPNGGRINMGAYGGTAYASMSEWVLPADMNRDGRVNAKDFAILAAAWLEEFAWLD